MRPARRFLAVAYTQDDTTARVDIGDERVRQRGPTVSGNEDVVRLFERDRGINENAAHTSAAVP